MKSCLRIILSVFCLFALVIAGHIFYLYTHLEFKPNEFKSNLAKGMKVRLPAPDEIAKEKTRQILSQRFSYLGVGQQMTAYESEDHKYVIKFFNPRGRLKEEWFHDYKRLKFFCSLKWLSTAYFKREDRLLKLFNCYSLAFEELKEESALVYVYLNSHASLNQSLEVIDKDGSCYHLNLDDNPFVLQRKVELAGDRLTRLLSQNDQKGFQEANEQLRHLFYVRTSKGLTDRLQTLWNNYGFLEDKAVQIDLGMIKRDESIKADPNAEIERIFNNIRKRYSEIK